MGGTQAKEQEEQRRRKEQEEELERRRKEQEEELERRRKQQEKEEERRRKQQEKEEERRRKINDKLEIAKKEKIGLAEEEKSQLRILEKSKNQIKTQCAKPQKQRQTGGQICNFKATPVREDPNRAGIHKYEKEVRKQIEEPQKYPNSVHGVVKSTFSPEKYGFGTGIVIGPNLVLTAAHNLYNNENQKGNLEFIPAINGKLSPFGDFKVIESYCPENWEENDDYAILLIDKSVGIETGYFGLHIAEKTLLEDKELNIVGYPAHIRDQYGNLVHLSSEGNHQQWSDAGKAVCFEGDDLINYEIFTTGGQSGSGVFYYDQKSDSYYVIGVHVLKNGDLNSATWITEKRFKQIEEWIRDANKKMITSKIKNEGYELIDKLNFNFMEIGPEEAKYLANFQLKNLQQLDLLGKNIGEEGAKALSTATTWTNLQQLDLSGNKIGDEGAKALSTATTWTNLQELNLSKNNIGDDGAKALSTATTWTNLQQLNLSNNKIGDDGAKALSTATTWTKLWKLDLYMNNIGDEGTKALSTATTWTKLWKLDLYMNNIGDEGAKALSTATTWTNLQQLNLSRNKIGDEGAKALSTVTTWTNLQQLNLPSNNIGDEGAKALSTVTTWTNLQELNLSDNNIGDEGAKALSTATTWTNLLQLNLSSNNIGDEGAKALKERWPNCSLYVLF